MLKRSLRLTSAFEYNVSKKYGKYLRGSFFHIYIVKPTNYTGLTRFGIVISNKFHKSAVARNKTKRLYRRALQENLHKFPENDHWVALYPKFNALGKTYEEIHADFIETISKTSLA